jgi:lipopolysaccharide export system permease protein
MIIRRYLIRKVLKNQMALLLILVSIFSSQKFIRVLSSIATEKLSARWIWAIVGFGFPHMLQLIIPLSLFLSLLLTYGALYANSEMVAMQAGGFSQRSLLNVALWLALLSCIPATVNLVWFGPRVSHYERQMVQQATHHLETVALAKGKFRRIGHAPWVLFIGDSKNQHFTQLFAAQGQPTTGHPFSIWIADAGSLNKQADGSRTLLLDSGVHYHGLAPQQPLHITQFKHYQVRLTPPHPISLEKSLEGHSLRWLWRSEQPAARRELHWRLTLLFFIPLMASLAVPLSMPPPRQHRIFSLLPPLLLYLIHFLLQTLIRSALERGQLSAVSWLWTVNGGYLLLSCWLNVRHHWRPLRLRLSLRA